MRVLVTGGCGYIGSVLVPQLLEDEAVSEVVVLDSLVSGSPRTLMGSVGDDLEFVRGDIRNYGDVETAMRDVDRVIHLAAITGASSTHDRRDETFAVNYDGTENVVTAAGKFDVDSVVFASSCNNYGRAASRNIDETTTPEPLNPYAESKVQAEELVNDAAAEHGFDATSLRMSTNYGYSPGVRFNLVVNHFVFRGLTDRPLTVYGDGNNWRPFIHVQDAARAYKHAALHPDQWAHDVYNVGSTDQNYQISDIAELVNRELDSELEITYLEDEQPGPSYHVNFDRLSETGFEPEWTLRDGVCDLIAQFEGSGTELQSAAITQPINP
ncbi:NAD-dependent epimerase/dehydratase [Haloterrigena turkmenica DSM 5511]|uniref:NAD-dependent epimerase/dehydratase n=1 Tax=Haloterrigena turkmenica (strain ATCC 51198 / DSM 5511 / JCM 9101 / NCIMB 13204 / VKM B-1734 / 4k) TaxID=543526 RepID=D2RP85_HALTV|nr:NAD(P)-dependent oxidoreductase [Haloterrigena turkmenica]ADB60119.1 NAD-dependent epimerase/dehydratase [Haloterrigena turkmenica DSM 5511]